MTDIRLPTLEELKDYVPPPRPVPNLGYACINESLSNVKPAKNKITTNRTCTKKTFEAKGLDYIGELVLQNVIDLAKIICWNNDHGIRLFRMSSEIFPWATHWDFKDLKDYEEIKAKCFYAGELARIFDQRLTFHPNHFVVLASPREEVVKNSLKELESHSEFLDMMGFEPSLWNKLNFHLAATYGDKPAAIERFKKNFWRLSERCRKRVSIENDDTPNDYSTEDLLPIAKELDCATTFDAHHHGFCPGSLSAEDAFRAAIATWKGVRPIMHHSESPEDPDKKRSAHSEWIKGPIELWGHDSNVDVMLECKRKEKALLKFRQQLKTESSSENLES